MKKDLRDREALRRSAELAALARSPAFDTVAVTDLRKLAELVRDYAAGTLEGIGVAAAAAYGGTSRHRFQCVQRALRALVGEDHPATRAVAAANGVRAHARAGRSAKDYRPREAVLLAPHWEPFRGLPGVATMPINELRAVDRFLAFSSQQGLPAGEVETFLAFVADKRSSMLLRTLRDGLESLLTSAHPAVVAAERARSLKEGERSQRRRSAFAQASPRALEVSVPRDALPEAWRQILDDLLVGKRVRRRRYAAKTVKSMTDALRQLLWAARSDGLPDEISLDAVRAYDRALAQRGVRASSRAIFFQSLRTFGALLGLEEELLGDLHDLAAYYERQAGSDVKQKEDRLADLPDLQVIFDRANALLDEAATTRDRRRLATLYVDAAALPFLSLIPLRNADTVLHWGRHIRWIGEDDPATLGLEDHDEPLGYYLDLRTSKTGAALAGPLAPILTPFLDALILRGQDARLLPHLRRQVMAAGAPVFPKSDGTPREASNLSARWRKQLGTGSIISRTRVHSLLGGLGPHGVRAALALCAQRSPRTAKWYQADALGRRRMLESQEMTAGLIELSPEDERLLAGLV